MVICQKTGAVVHPDGKPANRAACVVLINKRSDQLARCAEERIKATIAIKAACKARNEQALQEARATLERAKQKQADLQARIGRLRALKRTF